MKENNQTKITLVTGPLGAGKTTLLKDYGIKHYKQKLINLENKIKLIVNDAALGNEKGAFHTDGRRLSPQLSEDEIEMYGQSCVCCDGLTTFERALKKIDNTKVDRLIIEPTGIANAKNIVEFILDVNKMQKDVDKFTINNITYLFPVQRFSSIEQHSGLITANNIVLSHIESVSKNQIDKAKQYISKINSRAQILEFDENFEFSELEDNWNLEQYNETKNSKKVFTLSSSNKDVLTQSELISGIKKNDKTQEHAKYMTKTFDINPYAYKDNPKTLEKILNQLDEVGVERVKGHVRLNSSQIQTFDLARGKSSYNTITDKDNIYSNGSLEIISREVPFQTSEIISRLSEGSNEYIALIGSTKQELEKLLQQKLNDLNIVQVPTLNSEKQIPQTYEQADTALSLANQINKEGHGIESLTQIFPKFFDIQNQTMNSLQNNPNNPDYKARQSILGVKVMYELQENPQLSKTLNQIQLQKFSKSYLIASNNLKKEDYDFLNQQSNSQEYIDYISELKSTAKLYV